ncbi:N-glycosylase [Thermoplasma sp. Kam2015]|uniref:N-glycosylase/DNA lyase n=1 Tax=Thermoplasma sp. Kam2015 TaxID=2094122 RepID=UPI000DA03EA0|nr:N-glycosylase/DNA lyase [Thermoplasma sp. Kam2015]PYB69188.1 N-glycosylase [Thermoplasma sp. Kam2015]
MDTIISVPFLDDDNVRSLIYSKAEEFRSIGRSSKETLFKELVFCILAANTSASMSLRMQEAIGDGFLYMSRDELRNALKTNKYRFYNVRSDFIVRSRSIIDELPEIVKSSDHEGSRDYLVENVYGVGYKEASHFLRNVGIFDFAILDKHIMKWMSQYYPVKKNSSKKNYLYNEEIFRGLSASLGVEPGILDLFIWYSETGTVIK